jgi:transcriptional regulator GlxA family with amidase domain
MKRFFGLTPSQFIAKARVAAASRLLRETDQSVAGIALACGFYDHYGPRPGATKAQRAHQGSRQSSARGGFVREDFLCRIFASSPTYRANERERPRIA